MKLSKAQTARTNEIMDMIADSDEEYSWLEITELLQEHLTEQGYLPVTNWMPVRNILQGFINGGHIQRGGKGEDRVRKEIYVGTHY